MRDRRYGQMPKEPMNEEKKRRKKKNETNKGSQPARPSEDERSKLQSPKEWRTDGAARDSEGARSQSRRDEKQEKERIPDLCQCHTVTSAPLTEKKREGPALHQERGSASIIPVISLKLTTIISSLPTNHWLQKGAGLESLLYTGE